MPSSWEDAVKRLPDADVSPEPPASSPPRVPHHFGFRSPTALIQAGIVTAITLVFLAVLVASAFGGGHGGIWGLLGGGVAACWIDYLYLFRIGTSIEYEEGTIHWRAPLARRTLPAADITGSRASWINWTILKVTDGPRLWLITDDAGWASFVDSFNQAETTVQLSPSTWTGRRFNIVALSFTRAEQHGYWQH